VPPPPLPSLATRRRLRSSRTAWAIASLLGLIVGAALFLIVTGRLELKPAGDIAAMAPTDKPQELELDDDEKAAAVERPASVNTGLPATLVPAFDKLAYGGSKEARDDGIEALLGHQPASEVPDYVRHMALLQRSKTCEQKRDEVDALAELDDARALPVLQRLAGRPRTGCGRKKKEDCFACLRKPLAALVKKLEAAK
jgi:hypothetical protein